MTDKQQYEENIRHLVQIIGYEVKQAHRNGDGALTPKIRGRHGRMPTDNISAIGKLMERQGLLTNTSTRADDPAAWVPTDQLLEMS